MKMHSMLQCLCVGSKSETDELDVHAFAALRNGCSALRLVLAPDDAWRAIVADASAPNSACHRSCLLLAYQRGYLDRITLPIHHFLLDGPVVSPLLTMQYRKDLSERWLLEGDVTERQRRFKMFFGKVVELQVADWLSDAGWTVTSLEALGHDCDIAAQSLTNLPYSIEVKYIGQGADDFELALGALGGGAGAGSLPLYGAINYLLFRVYEIAYSLRLKEGLKMAVIVLDRQAWPLLELPRVSGWLNWKDPTFLRTDEQRWNEFLEEQRREHYPAIDTELPTLIAILHKVWIVRSSEGFQYVLEHETVSRSA
jgi:hypothetical protein